MTQNDGGPAFPGADPANAVVGGRIAYAAGMSLRDYFAAQAMGAFLSDKMTQAIPDARIAAAAYLIADAMLRARTHKEAQPQ